MCEKSVSESTAGVASVAGESSASAAAPAQPSAPVVAVVLAAGFGTRFDPDNPKQLVSVENKPIVQWSLEVFEHNPSVTDIVVVVNPKVRATVERLLDECNFGKVRAVVDGGRERSDSTQIALQLLADVGIPDQAKVLIHDAVRPFVEQKAVYGCIEALDQFEAATVAMPSTDTVLLTQDLGDRKVIASVPERPDTFRAQTPQAFRFATIRKAYAAAANDPDFHPTDDTRVVVDYLPDVPVAIVAGAETNLKITTLADIPVAEGIARARREAEANDAELWRNRMHAVLNDAAARRSSGRMGASTPGEGLGLGLPPLV